MSVYFKEAKKINKISQNVMFFGLIYFPLRLFTSSAYTNTFNIGKPCQYLSKCVPTPPPPYGMNPDPNGARLGRGTCALGSGSDADIDMK